MEVKIDSDVQFAAAVDVLSQMKFKIVMESTMILADGKRQTSTLLVNTKNLVGVELYKEECRAMPCKIQITQGGGYNKVPMSVPCRLFFNRPEILKAFLMEAVDPGKANSEIQRLPEA